MVFKMEAHSLCGLNSIFIYNIKSFFSLKGQLNNPVIHVNQVSTTKIQAILHFAKLIRKFYIIITFATVHLQNIFVHALNRSIYLWYKLIPNFKNLAPMDGHVCHKNNTSEGSCFIFQSFEKPFIVNHASVHHLCLTHAHTKHNYDHTLHWLLIQ